MHYTLQIMTNTLTEQITGAKKIIQVPAPQY
jgi:hypothetical protein